MIFYYATGFRSQKRHTNIAIAPSAYFLDMTIMQLPHLKLKI